MGWGQCPPPRNLPEPGIKATSPVSPALYGEMEQTPFLISQLFASGGQSFGASTSAISPSNEYSGLISFNILYNPTQILSP